MITNKRFFGCLLAVAMCITLVMPSARATGGYDPDGWTDIGHVHKYTGQQVRVEPLCEKEGYIGVRCIGCDAVRKDQTLPALGHQYVQGYCSRCKEKAPTLAKGDMNGDGVVNNADVVHLLWNALFPSDFSVNGDGDITADGQINNADVVLLLWHVLFPEQYPI